VSKRDTGVLLVVKDGIQLMITIATPMAILTAVLLSAASPACSGGSSQGTSAFGPPLASCETAVLQTPFAVNCGQAAEPVRFCAHIPGGAVLISDMGEVRYRAFRNDEETAQAVLTETLSGGLLNRVIQTRRTDVVIHYFRGNDSSKWITGIPTYGTLDFGEVYEGIRCELDVREGRLIRRFVLQPGTDPGRIRVRVDGEAVVLKTCPNGRIEAGAGPRSVLASRVTAVENRDGERVSVEIDYWVDGTEYGFGVGAYDSRYPLVIESAVDLPGGSRISSRPPVETGADKPQYILGGAPSLVRHSTAGAPLESMRGDLDVWIARFDADSGTPRAVAFVGGTGNEVAERPHSIAVDRAGDVFIAGRTHSTDFPTTPGAFDESYNFWGDVFVVKLDGRLSTLVASTFLGEWGFEYCSGLAIDDDGNVYVAGGTRSSSFPTTVQGHDPTYNGDYDIFVSRFDTRLASLRASTFFGGSGDEFCSGIRVSPAGEIYVTGSTVSVDFPIASRAYGNTRNAESVAFLSRFDQDLRCVSVPMLLAAPESRGELAWRWSSLSREDLEFLRNAAREAAGVPGRNPSAPSVP